MTISLTAAEFTELCETSDDQPSVQEAGWGRSAVLPKRLGKGIRQSFHLRGGLTVEITEGRLQQTLRVKQVHELSFPVTAKFILSGLSSVETPGVKEVCPHYIEQKGHSYLYHLPDLKEVEEWYADEPIKVVMIYADPGYFHFLDQDSALPQPLQQSLRGQRFHQSLGPISSAMRSLLQQILHCPYMGMTQALYLESKALELLALQLDQWPQQALSASQLPIDEVERLHQAQELLIRNADNPPLLVELARQVGLNDRKLKQGFRQLFGTTVFGYLQDYRMKQAKQLLEEERLTVAAIATSVGYRNPEAFSTAFRRKFSVSPKAYQLSIRG
ncbi:Regulatory protein PchR [Acaryochloris thomasi RCC1774]|uniref:Regulatory protein PchR n=1 Tax=Acaryochloris thomasi RCC1774 TaxID=1764569 RepID=A0A2W1JW18_9CYAN|nr:AraC family transcriptional regulator [Acaryochloris thomasi]PZD72627.1 Regulatory protein PchR [Acaryochloris thomasi RCC1774]